MSNVILPGDFSFNNDRKQIGENAGSFWSEQVGNVSPSKDEFSAKYAHSTLYGWIPGSITDPQQYPTPYYNAINRILGYSYLNQYNQLSRVNPMCHPRFPWLYALRIFTSEGHQFCGQNTGYQLPTETVGQLTQYAKYGLTLIGIDFAPVKYNILEDFEIYNSPLYQNGSWPSVGEFSRNVEYSLKMNTYDVNLQSLTPFMYLEGPGSGKTYSGEINYIEVKTTFNVLWRQVPELYLLDTEAYLFGYPYNLGNMNADAGAVGKVNLTPFGGYPAGTLLLLEPQVDRYLCGTLQNQNPREPVFYCDVQMPIVHFDPPNNGTYAGHNLKPYWSNNSTVFIYYLVGAYTTDGPYIYQEFDFNRLFEFWDV